MAKRCVIIGAGFAGLSAARNLQSQAPHIQVVVLEADDVVGGRAKAGTLPSGTAVELGATWFHGVKDNPVYDMAVWQGAVKDVRYENDLHKHDIDWQLHFARPGQSDLLSGAMQKLAVEAVARYTEAAEECTQGAQAQERTVGDVLRRTFDEAVKEEGLQGEALKVFADSWQFREKLQRTFDGFFSTDDVSLAFAREYESLDGPNLPVPGGYQALAQLLAQGMDVRTGHCVSSIQYGAWGALVSCSNGAMFEAEVVLVTTSVGVLQAQHATLFNPPLPDWKVEALFGVHIGVADKLFIEFEIEPEQCAEAAAWLSGHGTQQTSPAHTTASLSIQPSPNTSGVHTCVPITAPGEVEPGAGAAAAAGGRASHPGCSPKPSWSPSSPDQDVVAASHSVDIMHSSPAHPSPSLTHAISHRSLLVRSVTPQLQSPCQPQPLHHCDQQTGCQGSLSAPRFPLTAADPIHPCHGMLDDLSGAAPALALGVTTAVDGQPAQHPQFLSSPSGFPGGVSEHMYLMAGGSCASEREEEAQLCRSLDSWIAPNYPNQPTTDTAGDRLHPTFNALRPLAKQLSRSAWSEASDGGVSPTSAGMPMVGLSPSTVAALMAASLPVSGCERGWYQEDGAEQDTMTDSPTDSVLDRLLLSAAPVLAELPGWAKGSASVESGAQPPGGATQEWEQQQRQQRQRQRLELSQAEQQQQQQQRRQLGVMEGVHGKGEGQVVDAYGMGLVVSHGGAPSSTTSSQHFTGQFLSVSGPGSRLEGEGERPKAAEEDGGAASAAAAAAVGGVGGAGAVAAGAPALGQSLGRTTPPTSGNQATLRAATAAVLPVKARRRKRHTIHSYALLWPVGQPQSQGRDGRPLPGPIPTPAPGPPWCPSAPEVLPACPLAPAPLLPLLPFQPSPTHASSAVDTHDHALGHPQGLSGAGTAPAAAPAAAQLPRWCTGLHSLRYCPGPEWIQPSLLQQELQQQQQEQHERLHSRRSCSLAAATATPPHSQTLSDPTHPGPPGSCQATAIGAAGAGQWAPSTGAGWADREERQQQQQQQQGALAPRERVEAYSVHNSGFVNNTAGGGAAVAGSGYYHRSISHPSESLTLPTSSPTSADVPLKHQPPSDQHCQQQQQQQQQLPAQELGSRAAGPSPGPHPIDYFHPGRPLPRSPHHHDAGPIPGEGKAGHSAGIGAGWRQGGVGVGVGRVSGSVGVVGKRAAGAMLGEGRLSPTTHPGSGGATHVSGVLWITGQEALEMEAAGEEEVVAAVTAVLQAFPQVPLPPGARLPPRVTRTNWGRNPLFRGSYSYIGHHQQSGDCVDDLAEPLCDDAGMPIIMFAGEATHRQHIGTVHGAFLSGCREAERLLVALQMSGLPADTSSTSIGC